MERFVYIFRILIILLFTIHSFANNNSDSDKIIKEVDSILLHTPDSLVINRVIQKALYYKSKDNYNASIITIEKLFKYVGSVDKTRENYNELMKAKQYLGTAYGYVGLKEKGIKINTEVLLYAKEKKDTLLMIMTLNSLFDSYSDLKKIKKGNQYVLEAYNLSKKYNKSSLTFYKTVINTVSSFIDLDQLDLALEYLQEIDLELVKHSKLDISEKAKIKVYYYLNKGEVFYKKGNFNKALRFYKTADKISKRIKKLGKEYASFNITDIYIELSYSKIFFSQNMLDLAEKKALYVLALTKKYKHYSYKIKTLELLSKIYKKKKNKEKYVLYHQKYITLKDSLKINNLETKVENVKLLYKINTKENEIFVLKTREKEKNTRIRFLLLSLFTITMVSMVYFYQRNKKYRVYKKLHNENVKAVASHDEILKLKKEVSVNRLQNNNNEEKDNKEEKEFLSKKQIDEIELLILTALEEKVFLDKNLTLNKFAKIINTNTSYLSYVINTCFNLNFSDLINEQRVNWAKKLLLKDNIKYTIESIALSSGFSNSVTFNRNFKKITGITPSVYLKLSKK